MIDVRSKAEHLPELQALRGYAAILVLLGHACDAYDGPGWFHQASLIFNGRMAVVLFFTLSGFVLTRSLKSSDASWRRLIPFYVRRAARIYPGIWFVSIVTLAYIFLVRRVLPTPPGMSEYFYTRFQPGRMTPLHLAASFSGMLAYLIPQSWSIFIEIIGSIALPLIAFLAYSRRIWFYGFAAVFLIVSFAIGAKSYYGLLLYAFDFFAGAWAASLAPRVQDGLRPLRPYAAPAVAAMCLLALFTQFLPSAYYSPWAALAEATLATCIICAVAYGGGAPRFLNSKPAAWLGDVSYSVYLLHYLVLSIGVHLVAGLEDAIGFRADAVTNSAVLAAFTLVVTLLLAPVTFRGVETPGIALGKRLSARISRALNAGAISPRRADLQAESPPP